MKKKKMKKREKNFLKEQYSKSWDFIKESKNFIWSIVVIFFGVALVSFIFPTPDLVVQKIFEILRELLEKTSGMSGSELTGFIFFNNLQASFFGMIFGIIFGIFPVLVAVANGYLLGFVGKIVVAEEGFLSLGALLPHGIFELLAVFISLGLGMKLGSFIFQKKKSESFKEFFWNSLRVFIFVVVPLLIIAAIIEGSLIVSFGN